MSQVYDFPDPSVSNLWIEERSQKQIHYAHVNGHAGLSVRLLEEWDSKPAFKGRWLPVTLPTFPEREIAAQRLCWARKHGQKELFVYRPKHHTFYDVCGSPSSRIALSDIEWLSPEFVEDLKASP